MHGSLLKIKMVFNTFTKLNVLNDVELLGSRSLDFCGNSLICIEWENSIFLGRRIQTAPKMIRERKET